MDSSGCPEKSLPGMGIPRWMKRATERSNYVDLCASPPSHEDGFFHINRQRFETGVNNSDGQPNNVECYQNQKKKAALRNDSTPEMFPSSATLEFPTHESHHFGRGTSIILTNPDCAALKETSNFYKSISTTSASSLVDLAMASQGGLMSPTKGISEIMSNVSLHENTKPSISAQNGTNSKKALTLDSAVSSDDVSSLAIVLTKPNSNHEDSQRPITQQVVGKNNGLLLLQPPDDTTPSTTPSATPTCSPQVARRTGNPFFTGSQEKTSSGNWLFRSSSTGLTTNKGQDSRNPMYETKVEMTRPSSAGPGQGIPSQQKVRYVPRPSELRELNFWSPTSM